MSAHVGPCERALPLPSAKPLRSPPAARPPSKTHPLAPALLTRPHLTWKQAPPGSRSCVWNVMTAALSSTGRRCAPRAPAIGWRAHCWRSHVHGRLPHSPHISSMSPQFLVSPVVARTAERIALNINMLFRGRDMTSIH